MVFCSRAFAPFLTHAHTHEVDRPKTLLGLALSVHPSMRAQKVLLPFSTQNTERGSRETERRTDQASVSLLILSLSPAVLEEGKTLESQEKEREREGGKRLPRVLRKERKREKRERERERRKERRELNQRLRIFSLSFCGDSKFTPFLSQYIPVGCVGWLR